MVGNTQTFKKVHAILGSTLFSITAFEHNSVIVEETLHRYRILCPQFCWKKLSVRAIIGPSKKFYYKSQPGGEELNETNGQGSMVQEDLDLNPSPSNFFSGA